MEKRGGENACKENNSIDAKRYENTLCIGMFNWEQFYKQSEVFVLVIIYCLDHRMGISQKVASILLTFKN